LHPAQIATVHRAFSYSAKETAWALRLIAAAQDHAGAFRFEGRMVDAPVLMRAKRIAELSGCASIPDSQ
jgi:citrate lyase beta subunit